MPILIVCAGVFVLLLLYGYVSNFFFRAEYYTVSVPGMGEGTGKTVRIVMLADLHGTVFGTENGRLLRRIRTLCPDLVCIAGDMTVKDGRGAAECIALCGKLAELCPVYYAMGNHEVRMEEYASFCSGLRKAGVFVLDNEYATCFLAEKKICIYGWNADECYYYKCWQDQGLSVEELQEQIGFPEEETYHILLAHNPEYFQTYCAWGADLVLSGHVHGGIVRLPLFGGVLSPSLRLFPKYDAGEFREGDAVMVLSRGLGTHHIRLRFFNVPEISVIDLGEKDE